VSAPRDGTAPPRARKWLYGKTVVDGRIRFFSVSQLSKADPDEEGCPRKWFYETCLGRKPPQTKPASRGDGAHDQIAKYLTTGVKDLDALVMSGFHMLPKPGADLLVEHDMLLRPGELEPTTEAEAAVVLARAPLRCAGIPLLGRMDLVHGRGENQGAETVEDAYDPPGTIENCDWKTTSKVEYVKSKNRLLRLIQMAGYGMWSRTVEPGLTSLRLSHGYFIERGGGGPSRKVSLRVLPEEIDPTWARAESVGRLLIDAAKETSADAIPANTKACRNYGGCFHRDICKAGQRQTLAGFFGPAAADRMLGLPASSPLTASLQGLDMANLLDKLNARRAGGAAPPPPVPPPSAALAGVIGRKAEPGPTAEEIAAKEAAAKAAEIAKLQAEEAEQRGRRVVVELVTAIEAYNLGKPALGGEAARLYNLGRGYEHAPHSGLAGTGDLGGIDGKNTVEELKGFLGELQAAAAAGQIPGPTAAPEPPTETKEEYDARTGTTRHTAPADAPPAILPPEAPEVTPPAAAQTPGAPSPTPATSAPATETPVEAPKKRGRPVGSKNKQPEGSSAAPADAGTAIFLYVNCAVDGISVTSLWPAIDAILADAHSDLGIDDIRAAPDSSGLGFGKWKGALAAAARGMDLAPGHYVLDTRDSEIAQIFAEALGARARASGGAVVRGIR